MSVSYSIEDSHNQYVVRLIRKVVTVSIETVKLVEELAQNVKPDEWLGERHIEVSQVLL